MPTSLCSSASSPAGTYQVLGLVASVVPHAADRTDRSYAGGSRRSKSRGFPTAAQRNAVKVGWTRPYGPYRLKLARAFADGQAVSALPDKPRIQAPGLRVIAPDRLAIWPTERGFGLDVTWRGIDGLRAADTVKDALLRARIECRIVQGVEREWTVRVGPGSAGDVRGVLDVFLPA